MGRRKTAWACDFNPTCFSHPKAADGFTLSHADKGIRQFWIEPLASAHGKSGAAMGKALGKTCVTNVWIPDGMKDTPADRVGPRERLAASLGRHFQEVHLAKVEPRCGRAEVVRHRQRKFCHGFA